MRKCGIKQKYSKVQLVRAEEVEQSSPCLVDKLTGTGFTKPLHAALSKLKEVLRE